MKIFEVIVSVKLRYEVIAKSKEEAIEKVENAELPNEYVEDSFEIEKVNIN